MMSSETHILTVILDRLDHIETRMDAGDLAASDSRRRMHERQESQGILLIKIDSRVAAVEKAVDSAAPTLKEYAEVKAKISGAGMLGRRLWKIGAWLIGVAAILYGLRHDITA